MHCHLEFIYIYIYIYIYNNYVSVQSGMYLAPIRLLHEGIYLALIRLPHKGKYLINFIVFGYLAPITVFGYSFLTNDVMESGSCAKIMALTRNFGLI